MSTVTTTELQQLCDFRQHQDAVRDTLAAALAHPVSRLRFLGRYSSWNGFFGSGVATLAGKIGRARGCFVDAAQPIAAIADRSVYVASFFFDAARDEFDDRDTVHRDTHRCLAQSMLKGAIDHARQAQAMDDNALAGVLSDPAWLSALNARVAAGYGNGTPDDLPHLFAGIGYHLGSELLADQEFSIIDRTLHELAPELVAYLKDARVNIAGQEHRAYQWIAIHSGHGGGAEADHFEWATQGVRLAFRFVPQAQHDGLRDHLHRGFREFARDHREFFQRVNSDATP
ncbi:hypothetical protein [Agrilutibacter solisilvae]|uniref:Uncharacterized protein n=1 Tax=Agrilutibacter solisilvae TaxID=2763317 RepID=A0A974Y1V8_9GAMM|nr:hypothetical protein [Lysobacter solisilvae]QSX79872.1 hypothetical protein I8J32_008625 [Lysobacter solisilvae]